mgnify:FL=1|jgi:hypothetical protein
MSQFTKSVTGNSITHRTKTITVSDKIALPVKLKITEGPIESTKRSQAIQA